MLQGLEVARKFHCREIGKVSGDRRMQNNYLCAAWRRRCRRRREVALTFGRFRTNQRLCDRARTLEGSRLSRAAPIEYFRTGRHHG